MRLDNAPKLHRWEMLSNQVIYNHLDPISLAKKDFNKVHQRDYEEIPSYRVTRVLNSIYQVTLSFRYYELMYGFKKL